MFEIKKDGRDFYSMVYEIVKNAKKINGEYKNSEGQLIGFVHGSLDMEFIGFLYKEGITEKDYFYLGDSLIVKFDTLLEELKKGDVYFEDTQMTKKEMQHFIDYIDIKTIIDKYMKRELNQLKKRVYFKFRRFIMYSVEKDIRGVDYTVAMIVNNAVDIAQEFEDVRAICRGYLGHLEDRNKKIDPEFIVFLYNLGMSEDEKKEYLEDSKSYYHSFVEYMESLKRDVENKKENIELDYDMLDEFDDCMEFDDILCNYLERELKKLLGDKLVESDMYLDFCELDYTYEMRYCVSIVYYNEKNEIQDYSGTEEVYYRAY